MKPGNATVGVWYGNIVVVQRGKKALLVQYEGDEQWIPFSLIHEDSEIYESANKGAEGQLAIPEWKAEQLGWL